MPFNPNRRPRLAAPLLICVLASGCVSYQAKPVRPAEIVSARRALTIDPAEVTRRVAMIAPQRAGVPFAWDRLSLFAAATIYNPDVARQRPNMTLSLTTEYANDPAASSPWLFGGSLDIPLDIGGRRGSRIAVADLAVLSARYDVAEALWTARLALRKGLAERFIADRQIAALTALVQVRDRQYAAMARRVAAGEASRAELERVRADGADAGRRLGDAQAQRRTADRVIAAAIGVPVGATDGLALEWAGLPTRDRASRPNSDCRPCCPAPTC